MEKQNLGISGSNNHCHVAICLLYIRLNTVNMLTSVASRHCLEDSASQIIIPNGARCCRSPKTTSVPPDGPEVSGRLSLFCPKCRLLPQSCRSLSFSLPREPERGSREDSASAPWNAACLCGNSPLPLLLLRRKNMDF